MSLAPTESAPASNLHDTKVAPRDPALTPVIRNRWSPYSFDPARPIAPADLRLIFEAARWAASSMNAQPWRFLVGRRGHPTFDRLFSILMDFNKLWAHNAQVLILSSAATAFDDGNANRWAPYDLGAAVNQMILQAQALGIHARQMGGFHADKAIEEFQLPAGFTPYSVTALGYPGELSLIPERMQRKEQLPGARRPLESSVFVEWDTPADFVTE